MKELAVKGLFLIAGLINFVPLAGVTGDVLLQSSYGIEIASPELSLLLRHRAVLFGILGGMLLVAAFKPSLRTVASVCGIVSMASFAALYGIIGPDALQLTGVLRADIVGIVALGAAIGLSAKGKAAPTDAA
ncbi:MAG: hypothetical protein JJ850_09990 [Kordiimonadaceae bacterium]|nr:hypothetical protein [Kordiimonadaceae bacterium]MBO6569463.1 hypothetical protein [Kordiimonadaceae bacterium]MBO6964938.1 hypothetical protein [Kordiimonadaceae bacterium]